MKTMTTEVRAYGAMTARPGPARVLGAALVALLVLSVTAGCYLSSAAVLRSVPATGGSPRAHRADVGHLTPELARAVHRAVAQAAADGVPLRVTSGWRSPAEQQRLFDAAVAKYGSAQAASHWVLPPSQSAHVRGQAVDVGPKAGARWLEKHGAAFGLCRRYANEWWHFELLVPSGSSGCPAMEPHAGA